MTPQPPSEQEVFHAALELPAAQRADYLAQACAGDPALRARVESLLAVQSSADALFDPASEETQVGGTTPSNPGTRGTVSTIRLTSPTEKPGDLLGPYKLREQVGEGGCGVVYIAEQEKPIRRKVALKVIKLGMDTKSVIARFEAERQALALMDHPNIAKVLDAGTTAAGRPFFVMELVRGIRITDFCDQANLSTQARLDLFIKVCSAVQHAHQKGIIHRDIKPSNILVTLQDGVPVPKVIDFGIAKATEGRLAEATVYTELHAFVGTPAYMSPEQAEMTGLDIDTRADIYSLGVLLYELLTGKPPFDAKDLLSLGFDAMRRTIREVEPARPSTRLGTLAGDDLTTLAKRRSMAASQLQHQLQGDLDWIVMKALEKDRTRRYETANSLAADLTRHLTHEPVIARPPTAVYRFQKAYRRHKFAFAAAGAVTAALLIGIAASVWQALRATAAEKVATSEAKRATAAEAAATNEAERATTAERQAKAEATRAQAAEKKTAETLVQVSAERDAKELARKDAEAVAAILGDILRSPSPYRNGRETKVVELLDQAATKVNTDPAIQPAQRAKLQATLGFTYRNLGLPQQAIPLQEKVRAHYLATAGPEHRDTLTVMESLAISYRAAGRWGEAIKLQEVVLPLRRKLLGPEHRDTLWVMANLAHSYYDARRYEESLKLEEEVFSLSRKVLGPEDQDTLYAMSNLAVSYNKAGRTDEALKLTEALLPLRRKLLGLESPHTLSAMANLAGIYFKIGRKEEALKLREEVLPLRRKAFGSEHVESRRSMTQLANSYFDAGRKEEALKLREEVLALHRKLLGPEHYTTRYAMSDLALSYRAAGETAKAEVLEKEVAAAKAKAKPAAKPEAEPEAN